MYDLKHITNSDNESWTLSQNCKQPVVYSTHNVIKDIVSTAIPLQIVANSENKHIATNNNVIKNIDNVKYMEVINTKLVLDEDMFDVKSQIAGLPFLERILKRQEILNKRQQKINNGLEKLTSGLSVRKFPWQIIFWYFCIFQTCRQKLV